MIVELVTFHLSIHPSVHLSIRPSVHPSIRPSVNPPIRPASIRPFFLPSFHPSFCPSFCPSVHPPAGRPSVHPFIYLSPFFVDIDECLASPCNASASYSCNNTNGSYECACKKGYGFDVMSCVGM